MKLSSSSSLKKRHSFEGGSQYYLLNSMVLLKKKNTMKREWPVREIKNYLKLVTQKNWDYFVMKGEKRRKEHQLV